MKHNNPRLASLSRRLDPLWSLIARFLRLGRRDGGPAAPRSILLVELNMLGDIVMLIPLLRVIRRYHPNAHFGLMAAPWAREILEDTGLVDEFIALRAPWAAKGQRVRGSIEVMRALRAVRNRAWDWGIDVRGDVRNALLLALARARRRIGYNFTGGAALLTDVVSDDGIMRHIIDHHAGIARHLGMAMSEDERIPVLRVPGITGSKGAGSRRVIGFHFGASLPLRRMPLEEACALVLSYQHQEDTRLMLVDAPDVTALNSALLERLPAKCAARIERWAGNLHEFIEFLGSLDKFYAMDSGPAHLAAALGIDTTVFFGPHLSLAVRPFGRHVAIVERGDVPCRPCDQHRCTNSHYQRCLTKVVCLLGEAPP